MTSLVICYLLSNRDHRSLKRGKFRRKSLWQCLLTKVTKKTETVKILTLDPLVGKSPAVSKWTASFWTTRRRGMRTLCQRYLTWTQSCSRTLDSACFVARLTGTLKCYLKRTAVAAASQSVKIAASHSAAWASLIRSSIGCATNAMPWCRITNC